VYNTDAAAAAASVVTLWTLWGPTTNWLTTNFGNQQPQYKPHLCPNWLPSITLSSRQGLGLMAPQGQILWLWLGTYGLGFESCTVFTITVKFMQDNKLILYRI